MSIIWSYSERRQQNELKYNVIHHDGHVLLNGGTNAERHESKQFAMQEETFLLATFPPPPYSLPPVWGHLSPAKLTVCGATVKLWQAEQAESGFSGLFQHT
jgi:hypothetical protein